MTKTEYTADQHPKGRAFNCVREELASYVVRSDKYGYWGRATIKEWDKGGLIQITSDFGTYEFTWTSIGDQTLREFMVGLNFGYAMGKLTDDRGVSEFDGEATEKAMRHQICELRREDGISKDDAREAWQDLDIWLDDSAPGQVFCHTVVNDCTTYFDKVCYNQPENIPDMTRVRPSVQGFWDEIWPMFCAVWKSELNL